MKKFVVIAVALVTFSACQEKKFGAFVVAGKIANAPEQKVYLEELQFADEPPVILDSTSVKKSGTFELRAMAKEENLYRLVFEKGQQVYFINDENNIRIRIDANNVRGYQVEGSVASEQLHELLEKLRSTDSTYNSVLKQQDTLLSDSAKTVLRLKAAQTLSTRILLLDLFIKKTNSPAAICFAVGRYYDDPDVSDEHVKEILDAAASRFPEHSGINRTRSLVTLRLKPKEPPYELMNQTAPEIKLPTPAGDSFALSSLRGKYVLVDFWASWCNPCRRENPNVVAAYNKFKDKNFTILGVSLDQEKNAWTKAIQEDGLAWPQVSDLGYWSSVVVNQYKFNSIPFNVLIDPNGKIIAARLQGAALDKALTDLIK